MSSAGRHVLDVNCVPGENNFRLFGNKNGKSIQIDKLKKISQKFIVILFFSFLFSVSSTILIAKSKFLQENSGRF